MDPNSRLLMLGSGGSPQVPGLDVDDVFWNSHYRGDGSGRSIVNGLDLAGEGGMVWLKSRDALASPYTNLEFWTIWDTVRGSTRRLRFDATQASLIYTDYLTSFNSNGFSLGTNGLVNQSGKRFGGWAFRKAPKFLDIVQYTGDGTTNRNIAHSLDSVPGFIIIKRTDNNGNWYVAAKVNSTQYTVGSSSDNLILNGEGGLASNYYNISNFFTSSTFEPGAFWDASNTVNINGATYIAYLFASDTDGFGADGSEGIVKAGSYTGGTNASVNLGWEPQFVLVKRITGGTSRWVLFDNARGMGHEQRVQLYPNLIEAEWDSNGQSSMIATPTGFAFEQSNYYFNSSGETFIYLAIRKGPLKTPTSATQVFDLKKSTEQSGVFQTVGTKSVDMVWHRARTSGINVVDKIRGEGRYLVTHLTSDEGYYTWGDETQDFWQFDNYKEAYNLEPGYYNNSGGYGTAYEAYGFRRAPGFFDIVEYDGFGTNTGTTSAIPHSLKATPGLVIVKNRAGAGTYGGAGGWHVYHSGVNREWLYLNNNSASSAPSFISAATSTTFTVRDHPNTGYSGLDYIAYLFGTVPGVSKVGSYTGTGTTQQIDCGFTSGARFVIIKGSDIIGDWYLWDTARGISTGNDPYRLLNSVNSDVTSTDYIDPYSAGFEISSSAPAAINQSGKTFIFLAIA